MDAQWQPGDPNIPWQYAETPEGMAQWRREHPGWDSPGSDYGPTVEPKHYMPTGWGPLRDGREILEERPGESIYSIFRSDWWRGWPPEVYWTVNGLPRPGGPDPDDVVALGPSR